MFPCLLQNLYSCSAECAEVDLFFIANEMNLLLTVDVLFTVRGLHDLFIVRSS